MYTQTGGWCLTTSGAKVLVYPLIGVGEGQIFGLSYIQLMTMDLLQYDITVTEIHHTTCSKHVVVDGKGLVSMQPSHVYYRMCTKHRFKKNTKKQ